MARFLFTLEKTPMFPTCKLDPGKAQGTTSLIAGAFLYADFYSTFNSTILNQIEAGSRLKQGLDAVLQYRRQADQDQMAKRFKRCYILKL